MRNLYIIALAALTAVSAQAAIPVASQTSALSNAIRFNHSERSAAIERARATATGRTAFSPAEEEQPLWRPGNVTVSLWMGEWVPEEAIAYTYDRDGRLLCEISTVPDEEETVYMSKTEYTYNENGMLATRDSYGSDGTEFTPSERTVREYDERVTDFITDNQSYFWGGDISWMPAGNNYRRAVTRDDAGNVTRVELSIYYLGEYDPTEILDVEYGEDGKASKITVNTKKTNDGYNFYWQVTSVYDNIVWAHTDGQIVSTERLMTPQNGFSSCSYIDREGNVMDMKVEYPDNLGSYIMTQETEFDGVPAHNRVEFTILDGYGSYSIVQTENYDYEDEPETFITTERYLYDEWGTLVEIYAAEEFNGMEDIWSWMKNEVIETDPEYGYPLCYETSEYDPDEEEWSLFLREDKSNYINCHETDGVAITPAATDSAVRWYDINGMSVGADNLTPGLYIRHEGGRVSKVIVR